MSWTRERAAKERRRRRGRREEERKSSGGRSRNRSHKVSSFLLRLVFFALGRPGEREREIEGERERELSC